MLTGRLSPTGARRLACCYKGFVRPHEQHPASTEILRKRETMTTEGFVAPHAKDATFEPGVRSFYEYRGLGIKRATGGRVDAHVIRAAAGKEFSSQPHRHKTSFQLIYILKGWFVACKKNRPSVRQRTDGRQIAGDSADVRPNSNPTGATHETAQPVVQNPACTAHTPQPQGLSDARAD